MSIKKVIENQTNAAFQMVGTENNNKQRALLALESIFDEVGFKETLQKWENSDKTTPKPNREDFAGSGKKLLAMAFCKITPEIKVFEIEVKRSLNVKNMLSNF
jgi:hypothetical protein